MINERYDPYIKRVPTVVDQLDEIQQYDSDNLYPQRVEETRNRSFTLKSATKKLAEFLEGDGFSIPSLGSRMIGVNGEDANEVLRHVSKDKSLYDGFALHVGYNANYRPHRITLLKFKDCRLGLPDESGQVNLIKYNTNWERDYRKEITAEYKIDSFPVFNPDIEVVKAQIEAYGVEDYPGQILYYTPERNQYPLSTFDAVFDKAQSQNDIGVFELANIQEGFVGTTLFKYPGKFENKNAELKVQQKLNQHKGPGGSRIMVAENPGGEANNLFETINMPNVDKMFELTGKNIKSAIRENYSMPAEILGVMPESGMFNQENIKQAYHYYNTITQSTRNEIESVLKKILGPMGITEEIKIKPLTYLDESVN